MRTTTPRKNPSDGEGPDQAYHVGSMRTTASRPLAFFLAAIFPMAALTSIPAQAADPTPVPAPLVDLKGDTDGDSDSSSNPPTATASPTVTPSPATSTSSLASSTPAVAVKSDVLGGARLADKGPISVETVGVESLPKVKARTWVLADAITGEILAAKNAHTLRRPASTLKTLTALTLLPKLDPQATWIGTAKAQNTYGDRKSVV